MRRGLAHRVYLRARLGGELVRRIIVARGLAHKLYRLQRVVERVARHGERAHAQRLDLLLDELRLSFGEDDEVGTQRRDLLHVRVVPTADARKLRDLRRVSAVVRDGHDARERADAVEYLRRVRRERDDARGLARRGRRSHAFALARRAEQQRERQNDYAEQNVGAGLVPARACAATCYVDRRTPTGRDKPCPHRLIRLALWNHLHGIR